MSRIVVDNVRIRSVVILVLDKYELGSAEIICHFGVDHQDPDASAMNDLLHIVLRHYYGSGSGLSVLRESDLFASFQNRPERAVTVDAENISAVKHFK